MVNPPEDTLRIMLLRALILVGVCYATVQAVQWLMGEPFEWLGRIQFFGAVVLPLVITAGTWIQHIRAGHEQSG